LRAERSPLLFIGVQQFEYPFGRGDPGLQQFIWLATWVIGIVNWREYG